MNDITNLSATIIGRKIKAGELTSEEVTRAFLERISSSKTNSFITINDEAIKDAIEVDRKIKEGSLNGDFAGVPIAVKDNILTKSLKTTAASKMLSDFIPPYDATVIRKIKDEGMIILGKTNMDEFGMGSTSETSFYGPTLNPWNYSKVSGGSSGGSCASVASNLAPIALGSDTGGSIRLPSSYCGVIGIKPTYGSVSRFGLIAYASSFDQIGVISKDTGDAAKLLSIISGKDSKDQTSKESPKLNLEVINEGSIKGLRIGLISQSFSEGVDSDIKKAIRESAEILKNLGANVDEISFDFLDAALQSYYVISCAEASSNLARYDGIRFGYSSSNNATLEEQYVTSRTEGFGLEVKRRIMLGNYVLSEGFYDSYFRKALEVKNMVTNVISSLFTKYDLLLMPVSPSVAPNIDESLKDPLKMYLGDLFTVPSNIGGFPSISIPCGFDRSGMPIGMELISNKWNEEMLLRVSAAFQRETDYLLRRPANE